jgi:hypothetical protein
MTQRVHEETGDYYMDVRKFPDGGLELVVKTIRPMHSDVMHASVDPNSYLRYCRENGLPTGRNVTKKFNDSPDETDEYNKRLNHNRAVRRAKQNIRWLVCNFSADRLFTLSYRENVIDRERVKQDFWRFLRLVRKGWGGLKGIPEWKYVAVTEQQERGAFHIHCAVKGWQKIAFLRAAWQKALGGTGEETGEHTLGNVDVTSPKKARWGTEFREWKSTKLSSYLTKYLAKTFSEETFERKRYWHSKDVTQPVRERFILPVTTLVDALIHTHKVLFDSYGRAIDFTRSWLSGFEDALWLSLEKPSHA